MPLHPAAPPRLQLPPTEAHASVPQWRNRAGDNPHQLGFSLATGVVGVMHAAAASIHAIGLGLAVATGRETRHAINIRKAVRVAVRADRLESLF